MAKLTDEKIAELRGWAKMLPPDLLMQYPDKLRDRIGMFMLRRGVKMGVAVDPGEVQDLIEAWEREAHPYLEEERDRYKKLAEDTLKFSTPSLFRCLRCGTVAPLNDEEIAKHRGAGCSEETEGVL